MNSTTGKNDDVSAPEADTEMTEAELAIWTAAFAAGRTAGFAVGRDIGYKQGIDACRSLLGRMPRTPPALPEEQEKNAETPLGTSIDELELTNRTRNILKREGIHSIYDIVMRSEAELGEIRLLSHAAVDEINDKLAMVGYTIRAS